MKNDRSRDKVKVSVPRDDLLELRRQLAQLRERHEEMVLQCELMDRRLSVMLGLRREVPKVVQWDSGSRRDEIVIRTGPDPERRARNLKRRGLPDHSEE